MGLSFHRQEQRLRRLLRMWAFVFAVVAGVQLWDPAALVHWLNSLGAALGWTGPELALPATRFYSSLGISLLAVLIVLCMTASNDIKRRAPYVRVLILSKCVSTLAYLIALVCDDFYFAYLAAAIADGFVALLTYAFYRRVSFV